MWLMTDQESLTFVAIVALMVAVVLLDCEIDCAKGSPYIRKPGARLPERSIKRQPAGG